MFYKSELKLELSEVTNLILFAILTSFFEWSGSSGQLKSNWVSLYLRTSNNEIKNRGKSHIMVFGPFLVKKPAT